MIKLTNIKINNNIISANYEPDGTKLLGYISIDIKNDITLIKQLTSYDENIPSYSSYAIRALKELSKKENIPNEKTIMWH